MNKLHKYLSLNEKDKEIFLDDNYKFDIYNKPILYNNISTNFEIQLEQKLRKKYKYN